MDLYFTYESRDSLKSFTLFITVKNIARLNPEHSDQFKILAVVVHVLQTTENLVISRQRNVPGIVTHVHSYCTAH